MRYPFALTTICGLAAFVGTGCNGTSPAQIVAVEPSEKPKVIEIKDFDGSWDLKSSAISTEQGIYPVKATDGAVVIRIKEGVAEIRKGNGSWLKYCTFSLGAEPNCLQGLKTDSSGQQRVVKLRYKLEGNTLITVQDNIFPDILPDSFDMNAGSDRQRQTNTYIKSDR
jgi:hypothetical protein